MANITEMAKGKFATTAKINFTEDYRFGREEDDFRNVNAKCGIFTAKIKKCVLRFVTQHIHFRFFLHLRFINYPNLEYVSKSI